MHRSYVPKVWIDSFLKNHQLPLPKESGQRFISVLRVRPDEKVAVFDGCGRELQGYVQIDHHTKAITLHRTTLHKQDQTLPEIVVMQAALDEAKIAEAIKRGSEFGADRFIIFNAEHSEKHCFDKLVARQDRLLRIAEDASRQSGRFFIPSLSFVQSMEQVIILYGPSLELGVYGDLLEKKLFSDVLKEKPKVQREFYIVVGPEGGLSTNETTRLKEAGFIGVSWAPYTLRAELASLAAVAIFNTFYGRA